MLFFDYRNSKFECKIAKNEGRAVSKLTIHDVADAAGVSISTVDRVLNKRSGVRDKTVRKVMATVQRLNYQPDRVAARLSRGRDYRLVFVIPGGGGDFVSALQHHIGEAARRGAADRLVIDTIETDILNGANLAETLNQIDKDWDGIALVALDHPLVRGAVDSLRERGVHVVTLVCDLPSSRREHFVGIDNAAAGRTAGSLLGRLCRHESGSVGLIVGSSALRDHVERRYGFEQILRDEFPGLKLLPIEESADREDRLAMITRTWLKTRDDLTGIYAAGAGLMGAVTALETAGRQKDVILIGHDLTPAARRALTSGTLDALINQNIGHEVRSAVRILISLIDGTEMWTDQEHIRIDIFLRDNLP